MFLRACSDSSVDVGGAHALFLSRHLLAENACLATGPTVRTVWACGSVVTVRRAVAALRTATGKTATHHGWYVSGFYSPRAVRVAGVTHHGWYVSQVLLTTSNRCHKYLGVNNNGV